MQTEQDLSSTNTNSNTSSSTSTATNTHTSGTREYERSGCYPQDGKPFRIWALLGWLTALIVLLAGVAALLNMIFLDVPA